jgi:beta-N-acetylhexosaminidase
MPIGELFILGFFGKTVPGWLKEFAARYGLGGVILFDYSCRTQAYDNNIESPEQVQRLCAEIAALPSGPMVFIDQEGGLVRRLKESRGFAPLPSAKEFNLLAPDQKRAILTASFAEMRRLGIHYDSRRWSMSITTPIIPISAGSSVPFPLISPRWKPMRCWQARRRGHSASASA